MKVITPMHFKITNLKPKPHSTGENESKSILTTFITFSDNQALYFMSNLETAAYKDNIIMVLSLIILLLLIRVKVYLHGTCWLYDHCRTVVYQLYNHHMMHLEGILFLDMMSAVFNCQTLRLIDIWFRCCPMSGIFTRRAKISMGWCKKDVTPLLTYWSYFYLAVTHRYQMW